MREKGEGEGERGGRMGETLLRMDAVSSAAPLLLPHSAFCTNSLMSDTLD